MELMQMPAKRKTLKPGETHYTYIRIPYEVMQRLEAKVKKLGRPLNSIIINELRQYPELEKIAALLVMEKKEDAA